VLLGSYRSTHIRLLSAGQDPDCIQGVAGSSSWLASHTAVTWVGSFPYLLEEALEVPLTPSGRSVEPDLCLDPCIHSLACLSNMLYCRLDKGDGVHKIVEGLIEVFRDVVSLELSVHHLA